MRSFEKSDFILGIDNDTLITPFGRARLTNGYYQITSRNENSKKLLHRLIWESYYNTKIPKGYVIHHLNENKNDNRIQNLQCISSKNHRRYHQLGKKNNNYGKIMPKKIKEEISIINSKNTNTCGYYRVTKQKNPKLKQGFTWVYQYYEKGKRIKISSTNLEKLKEKVCSKNLNWFKLGGD